MGNGQWKKAERSLARFFGAERRPLSGSNQGEGEGDDARHDVLYLESKYAKYHPVYTLYLKCKEACRTESVARKKKGKSPRVPVIGLRQKNLQGFLLVFHSEDLPTVVREWLQANPDQAKALGVSFQAAHPVSSPKKPRPRPRHENRQSR